MSEKNWEQLLERSRNEHHRVEQELKEIDMLIQQTSSEVDRLVQANARAVSKTRQMESQFETYPREDIKANYNTLLESQQRLFTMRGQLEKLQSDQKNLSHLYETLGKVLEFVSPGSRSSKETEEAGPSNLEAMIISTIEAQELERLRLSRQMHDGPAQALTNLVLQAEICERLFDRDTERARQELRELKNDVVKTFQKVKAFIFDLRPMMLDDLGLVPTMKRYIDGLEESGFTGVKLNVSGKELRMASHKEVTIFRIVQELIHIAREHGRATTVKINLDMSDSQAKVTVEDDGSGYELDEKLTTPDASALGLATLRERVEVLGGQINLDSTTGQGMRVTFVLPREEEET
jgi:two-component system sensor histidine kinase DegS